MTEPSNLRSYERYIVREQLKGSFGSAEVWVVDLGEQGAQIEHAHPLRISTTARFWFKTGSTSISATGLVVWSRLSKRPNDQGKLLYRSGLRIEDGAADFAISMMELAEKQIIQRDTDSLIRKQRQKEERETAKTGQPQMRFIPTESDVPQHQVLLIEHAHERLKANPDEAQKWYSRAYYAVRQGQTPLAAELTRYKEDVLAVWEYLERSIPLSTIARVFEKKG